MYEQREREREIDLKNDREICQINRKRKTLANSKWERFQLVNEREQKCNKYV